MLLLPTYETKLLQSTDVNSIMALANLLSTIRKHGGNVFSDAIPMNNEDAFIGLSRSYRVLRIMLDGSEIRVKSGKQTIEEHEALVQIAAQCKELARLFYSGDAALFEDALMQLPPHIAAFAARVSQDIKEDPKFREALITVIPEIVKHMDTMIGSEDAEASDKID